MVAPDEQLLQQLQQLLRRAGQGEACSVERSSLGGFTVLLVVLSASLLLAAAGWLTWTARLKQRQRLEAAAELASPGAGELWEKLRHSLPSWAVNPDASSCLWINALMPQLWGHVQRFAGQFLLEGDFLEGQLNGTQFWRPAILRSSYFKVQGVALGQEPPRVTGIKAFPKQGGLQDEILVESSFVWDSKLEVKLLATLLGQAQQSGSWSWQSLLSRVSRVKVGVSNLAVKGTMRISIKPLLDDFPFAGSVKVSLMGTPDFSYQLNVLGGDPYLVPGVKLWVDSFIKDVALVPFTFPDGFSYDLVNNTLAPFERPEGLLEVQVVEAVKVPRMDVLGKCDPYVKLWVRDSQKLHTATKSRTLSPVWDETFTFLVHSAEHQSLGLALLDSDMWPNPDDLVGTLSIPISSLDLSPGAVNDLWLPVPRTGKRRFAGLKDKNEARDQQRQERQRQRERERQQGQRVKVERVPSEADGSGSGGAGTAAGAAGAAGAAAGASDSTRLAAREDTAKALSIRPRRQQQQRQQRQQAQLAVPGEEPSGGFARTPSGGIPTLSSLSSAGSGALQQLLKVAGAPLEALMGSKECLLHVIATYYPLTEREIAAVEREASRGRHNSGLSRSVSLEHNSRVSNMLRGGVLYVYLDRAAELSSRTTGFTKNMKVYVSLGDMVKTTERGKVPFRHRSNPVFDETVELVVPGALAQQADAEVQVEVWVQHWMLPDTFKGRVSVPLADVISSTRLRDTFMLKDCPQGRASSLTMELSWMGTLSQSH